MKKLYELRVPLLALIILLQMWHYEAKMRGLQNNNLRAFEHIKTLQESVITLQILARGNAEIWRIHLGMSSNTNK